MAAAEPNAEHPLVGMAAIERLQRPGRLEDPLTSPEALLAWLQDVYDWKMRESPTFRTKIKVVDNGEGPCVLPL